ncbi:energy transducer TonB [Cupriavidus basilensis]|uniref:Energy transducer TonB n=1 Tax=Cupriavidus basilensis TaxID=68895 RepID=A0A7M2GQM8_9BURK|nr:energy transducer TonB [Cupriavidus basilensis]
MALTSAPPDKLACLLANPKYPAAAREQGIEGKASIRATMDATGEVVRADVLQSSGSPALDSAAVEAVMESRCNPYRDPTTGELRPMTVVHPINFALK